MTKTEMEQEIEKYQDIINRLQETNRKMEEVATTKVKEIQLNATASVVMQEIHNSMMTGVKYAVINTLSKDYQNPLTPMVTEVILQRKSEIQKIINEAFNVVITEGDLLVSLKSELSKKLARELLNSVTGNIESAINMCKQDPVFKSKVIVKINEILDSNKGK